MIPRHRRFRPPDRRGFVLLAVLWSLALLALLATMLVADVRVGVRLTVTHRNEAVAAAAADAAIAETIVAVLKYGAAGVVTARRAGSMEIEVSLENLSGRINPNIVPAPVLQALLQLLGAGREAQGLAAAIVDWRSPGLNASPHGAKAAEYLAAGRSYRPDGRPFEQLDELGAVLGMTPQVLTALLPHLTLWSDTDPNPAYADAVVLAALRLAGQPPAAVAPTEAQVIAIRATATMPGTVQVIRRAVIRFGYSPDGRGWRALVWDGGDRVPAAMR